MNRLTLLTTTLLLLASFGTAQTPPAAAPPATPAAAPVPITDADLKGIETPKAEKRAAGDLERGRPKLGAAGKGTDHNAIRCQAKQGNHS